MKRLFGLVMAVCMLMSAAAFAQQGAALQNEQPPKIISFVNEAGESVIANICDQNGNVIAQIKENGELVLTDAHFRSQVEDGATSERLTLAYEGVMENVHHSDVECKLHDHELKVDINAVLASLQTGADAHELVMYEMFDVLLRNGVADLLKDGNYLEITFEVGAHQTLPLIIMYSVDGKQWQVIPGEKVGDNRFTVRLPANGTLALLCDGRETMGIGQERMIQDGTPGDVIYSETDNFTPSVSGKDAPAIIGFEIDGERYISRIRGANNEEILVPDKNYVFVTPVSQRNHVTDIQTHEHLEWAFDSIMAAEDMGQLYTEHDMSQPIGEHEHGTIAGMLDETLKAQGFDLTHDQLVVKDLFEVSAYGEYLHDLYDPNFFMEVSFATNVLPGQPFVVIHSKDSVHWHVHPAEDMVVGEDGTVTLKLYDMGAVAFLVEKEYSIDVENAVQAP